jgi:hypothetical protein
MSVCPLWITRLPLDGFWRNFMFELFTKTCRANSSFIKIQQEQRVLYMMTFPHLWRYLAEFFLEWEMFQIQVAEKIKTHILCSVTIFRKSCRYEIMSKNVVEPERPHMTIWHMRVACWIRLQAGKHTHARTLTQKDVILIAFPVVSRPRCLTLYVHCLSCLFLFVSV